MHTYGAYQTPEEFVASHNKLNPDSPIKLRDVRHWLARSHWTCSWCKQLPIWVAGSAIMGEPVCFTCITGSTDASEDYEVREGA